MAQLLDKMFKPIRVNNPLVFTGTRPVQKQKTSAKKYEMSNSQIEAIIHDRCQKTSKKQETTNSDFVLFEDDTATKAANPTPDEIKNDPAYFEYGDEDAISLETTLMRQGTKRVMQKTGMKYCGYIATYLLPIAAHLDTLTPFTGPGFEQRLSTWQYNQKHSLQHGVTHPRGYRHTFPSAEEEWFTLEAVEQLVDIGNDIHDQVMACDKAGVFDDEVVPESKDHCPVKLQLLAGYCIGFGGGMDVGSPGFGDYLDDGRRNPEFFNRLTKAWSRIVRLYMDQDFEKEFWADTREFHVWWVATMRKINGRAVNWKLMEHFWGDSCPPCGTMRSFGVDVNRVVKKDLYGEERHQMGIDEFVMFD